MFAQYRTLVYVGLHYVRKSWEKLDFQNAATYIHIQRLLTYVNNAGRINYNVVTVFFLFSVLVISDLQCNVCMCTLPYIHACLHAVP